MAQDKYRIGVEKHDGDQFFSVALLRRESTGDYRTIALIPAMAAEDVLELDHDLNGEATNEQSATDPVC